ncbi:hypothetical protein STRTUCAR8_02430, partial [Streptomyces turgidiscabies Car8]
MEDPAAAVGRQREHVDRVLHVLYDVQGAPDEQQAVAVGERGRVPEADEPGDPGARVHPVQSADPGLDDEQRLSVGRGGDAVGVDDLAGHLIPVAAQGDPYDVACARERAAPAEREDVERRLEGVGEDRRARGQEHVVDEGGGRGGEGVRGKDRPRTGVHDPGALGAGGDEQPSPAVEFEADGRRAGPGRDDLAGAGAQVGAVDRAVGEGAQIGVGAGAGGYALGAEAVRQ